MADYQPYAVNKIFNYVEESDKDLNLFKSKEETDWQKELNNKNPADIAAADYSLNKYANDPYEPANLEHLQFTLDILGIVAPPADAINAAIYLNEKQYGMAALNVAGIIPFVKELGIGWKMLKDALFKGEETVKLYRGVRGIDNIEEMYDNTKKTIVGNWKKSAYGKKPMYTKVSGQERVIFDGVIGAGGNPLITTFPKHLNWDNLLFTTTRYDEALRYASSSQGGKIIEFTIPLSYVNKHSRNVLGNRWTDVDKLGNIGSFGDDFSKKVLNEGYPSVLFTDGLPVNFITNVDDMAKIPVSKMTQRLFDEVKKHPDLADRMQNLDPVHFKDYTMYRDMLEKFRK